MGHLTYTTVRTHTHTDRLSSGALVWVIEPGHQQTHQQSHSSALRDDINKPHHQNTLYVPLAPFIPHIFAISNERKASSSLPSLCRIAASVCQSHTPEHNKTWYVHFHVNNFCCRKTIHAYTGVCVCAKYGFCIRFANILKLN